MSNEARVEIIDGKTALIDPVAYGVALAVAKANCKLTFDANKDRIEHFKDRMKVLDYTPTEAIIIIANVDEPLGSLLADALMPDYDWQAIRDSGQVPYARGLALRGGVQDFVQEHDELAHNKMVEYADDTIVVVIDYGAVEVFLL